MKESYICSVSTSPKILKLKKPRKILGLVPTFHMSTNVRSNKPIAKSYCAYNSKLLCLLITSLILSVTSEPLLHNEISFNTKTAHPFIFKPRNYNNSSKNGSEPISSSGLKLLIFDKFVSYYFFFEIFIYCLLLSIIMSYFPS